MGLDTGVYPILMQILSFVKADQQLGDVFILDNFIELNVHFAYLYIMHSFLFRQFRQFKGNLYPISPHSEKNLLKSNFVSQNVSVSNNCGVIFNHNFPHEFFGSFLLTRYILPHGSFSVFTRGALDPPSWLVLDPYS